MDNALSNIIRKKQQLISSSCTLHTNMYKMHASFAPGMHPKEEPIKHAIGAGVTPTCIDSYPEQVIFTVNSVI